MFFYATCITPAMIMRLTDIGSQYIGAVRGLQRRILRRRQDLQGHAAAKDIPAGKFWSFTVYDNQTRSMLDTPQRYPRAGSQSYPTPAAEAERRRLHDGVFRPEQARRRQAPATGFRPIRGKGWSTILRLYSPLEPFFTKKWRPSEIELVK